MNTENKQKETIEADTIGTNHRAEQLAILNALLASGHYSIRCEYDGDDFLGGAFRLHGETLAITQALAIHREFDSLASPAATSPATQEEEY